MGVIKCCIPCVAPKRHPGCHDHCPEYIEEKAEHERKKAAEDKEKAVRQGIYAQKSEAVTRAIKKHGSNRKK